MPSPVNTRSPDVIGPSLEGGFRDAVAEQRGFSAFVVGAGAPFSAQVARVEPDPDGLNMRVSDVLAAWRATERELASSPEGSPAHARLLSVVSRELRTPITVIRTVAGLLLEPTAHPTAEQHHAMLRQVERNAERMQHLVDDILDLARYRSGAIGLQLRPFDPIELSEAVVATIQPLAESRHQVVDLDIPRRPAPRVYGDRSRLEQALLNLVANAHHFTPEAGHIAVSLKGPTYGFIEWSVKDDGPGIPASEQAKLFERFFVGRRASEAQDGVGLGLPTALAIAEAHGGSMGVTSRPGEGSTFTLGVPVAGPPQAS